MSGDSLRPFAHRLQSRPSLTAEAVTVARALAHVKPPAERVVDDPWAHLFLSSAARRALAAWSVSVTGRVFRRLGATGTSYVPLRHRFIDEHLAAALDAGVAQVALLGAGYDTRAYRFADQLDGRPVFEVDLAPISRAKAATIAKHHQQFPDANVVRVEIDFESQALGDVLADAGFTVGGPTFFTWEGVPMYLTRAAVKATLDAVHELSADGSQIAHDMWFLVDDPGPLGTACRAAPGALSLLGEPITFGVHPEDYEHLLGRHGFRSSTSPSPRSSKPATPPAPEPSWTTRCMSSQPNAPPCETVAANPLSDASTADAKQVPCGLVTPGNTPRRVSARPTSA